VSNLVQIGQGTAEKWSWEKKKFEKSKSTENYNITFLRKRQYNNINRAHDQLKVV